jgi:UDPglucose--hexose-1-phosphate uridylyltransferase
VTDDAFASPHRRHDPLRDSWVLVSAGRDRRPWKGSIEAPPPAARPAYDPACQLCPGNERASGIRNPAYDGTFVFTNDFPALRPDAPATRARDGLNVAETEAGTARVLCFSPRHDLSLGSLPVAAIRSVVDLWAEQTTELGERYRWVQVFENRGEAMGASNPHPHGQLWAGDALPTEPAREDATQRRHWGETGRRMLVDVAAREAGGPRAVEEIGEWLAVVPFWAAWPFELLLMPREPIASLPELSAGSRRELADLLSAVVRRLDGLFGRPFPYSMGWHQAPTGPDREAADHWQLHAHLYPPLLRADTRKWMVGYELLAEPQRDLTPEEAAERLRAAALVPAEAPGAATMGDREAGDREASGREAR